MTIFVEDPWSRIVAVHWADEGDPGEPIDYAPGVPYCGRYGYGAQVADAGDLITALPYGPNQFPPMVGTFSTTSNNDGTARYGGLTGVPVPPIKTLDAAPWGLIATNIYLGDGDLTFTNNQLTGLVDEEGHRGAISWRVPMAEGASGPGGINNPPTPVVIKSYTINMEWEGTSVNPFDQVGLGFTHPIPGWNGPVPKPFEPFVMLGSRAGGSDSFFYDFNYFNYRNTPVTESNQFDPGLGGPVFVWWMTRRAASGGFTAWVASSQFMVTTIVGLGDQYTWEIIAECQLLIPSLDRN